MPDNIQFAFVLTKNLNRKFFPVPQAIANIAVEGAEDPLTHQRMRDAVSDEFTATQKKVNDLIKARDLQISRLGVNERRAQETALLKTGNDGLQRFLTDFQQSADHELEAFARKEKTRTAKVEQAASQENWQSVRWVVSVTWTGVKAFGGLAGAVTSGGAAAPLAIKEFVDNLLDLKKLFEDLGEHYMSLAQARRRVRDGLSGLKSRPQITASEVEAFSNTVNLYEARLLVIEVKAQAIATKVNVAVTAMPTAGFKPEAVRLAEQALDKSVHELMECAVSIKTAETYLTALKKTLGTARSSAKRDAALTSVKKWAMTAYSKINDFKDIVLSPTELATWIDVAVKVCGDTRNMLEA